MLLNSAFEDLAQAMRVLLEADWRAHSDGLLFVDRAEAVGNIETAVNAVVNALHSLSDAMQKQLPGAPSWYEIPEAAVLLAVRNARHHNKANKIRNLYNLHVQQASSPTERREYVLVDFPAEEEGADTFDVYLSWADLDEFLALPSKESHIRAPAADAIRRYLDAPQFLAHAQKHGVSLDRVFFNLVPLIVNAMIKISPMLDGHLNPKSTEAKSFSTLFNFVLPAKTRVHDVSAVHIFLLD
ncbi:hypothetical protein [Caballeronia sp. NCTM1]|uniref:hypothetical protein n=1 Tax=Caballeronia sp. NCTM1 TaxID=2921753 RepID=UPI0020284023|nr:hypothetical protein [Caballeronia sp. NCTM1]